MGVLGPYAEYLSQFCELKEKKMNQRPFVTAMPRPRDLFLEVFVAAELLWRHGPPLRLHLEVCITPARDEVVVLGECGAGMHVR